MNNHRLLTGLLVAISLGGGVCAFGQTRRVVTIEDLYTVAEENSAQLRPYFTAEAEARREISVARSGWLPDVSASLSLNYIGDGFTTSRNFSDRQKAPIPHFGNTLGISASQTVYAGGAIASGVELAELKTTAARYATELQRDNIRFRLTGFYLDIYKYGNLRTVVENNIAQARKVLAEMHARHGQGVALQNDITRYELLVSSLELQLVKVNNTLNILNHSLVTMAGLPEDTEIVPDSTILARSLPVAGEGYWQAEAAANAPSLKLAGSAVDISRRSELLVRSEMLPKVRLQAGWNFDGPILVEVPPINRNLSYWYVGVGVNYNLSSLYKSNKSLGKSRAATRLAIERVDAASESLNMEVRADYVRYLEAYEELKTRQKGVELAARNYRTVALRYAEGMALITDMLDAANSKFDAEQQLTNARIDIIYHYYKLLFISGKI